jgi:hypothetical protein
MEKSIEIEFSQPKDEKQIPEIISAIDKSGSKGVYKWIESFTRYIRMVLICKEINHALEAAWYGMEKHAKNECQREILIAKKILQKTGSLPKKRD